MYCRAKPKYKRAHHTLLHADSGATASAASDVSARDTDVPATATETVTNIGEDASQVLLKIAPSLNANEIERHRRLRECEVSALRQAKLGQLGADHEPATIPGRSGIEVRPHRNVEEKRALKILNESSRFTGGDRKTGLLWRADASPLTDNYDSARSRLEGIERKLDSDAMLKEAYSAQICRLIDKGYAVQVERDNVPEQRWFLPHFAVLNPNKPGKIRSATAERNYSYGAATERRNRKSYDIRRDVVAGVRYLCAEQKHRTLCRRIPQVGRRDETRTLYGRLHLYCRFAEIARRLIEVVTRIHEDRNFRIRGWAMNSAELRQGKCSGFALGRLDCRA
ncbi:hypothetical protein EVAR_69367_1 [Eumeta japonica]|uniref:Uncharacterized protein n=1 Tax=Eumeta variegata TaxID=151549 RepID=A0A4C1T924_EUMVA|nr:hypothetical protein EVAR_69367_1 [Eumeta japonica]